MSSSPNTQTAAVRLDGDMVEIRFPVSELHGARVPLGECPCRAPKSIATQSWRQRLATALGRLQA